MRRADAAGGEDVVVAVAQRVDGGDDLVLLVGDDADFLQVDADRRHDVGEVADVPVLGAAGKNFVADDDHGGGDDVGHAGNLGESRSQIARRAVHRNVMRSVNDL